MIFAVERLFADVRNAARNLRKTPGFTATVIITLMLGVEPIPLCSPSSTGFSFGRCPIRTANNS